ncbi:MAG: hypothetical protein JXA69_07255 [Phycisphaerae bacterium]|nr:hypothetical protein [Phycisphaerae bacterium]
MRDRSIRTPGVLAAVVAVGLGMLTGCVGSLNPALVNSLGGNTASAIDNPEGSLLIVVMNRTDAAALTVLDIQKDGGGTVPLSLLTRPNTVLNDLDHVIVHQDCDVARIDFREIEVVTSAGSIPVPFALPPLIAGTSIFCGEVVAITIDGAAPNVFATVAVY